MCFNATATRGDETMITNMTYFPDQEAKSANTIRNYHYLRAQLH